MVRWGKGADNFSVQEIRIDHNDAFVFAASHIALIYILPTIMFTAPFFSCVAGISKTMKNSDRQLCICQIVLFDELQDLHICEPLTPLKPDWRLAFGQVLGFLVLFCARDVTEGVTTSKMFQSELEESCNLCAISVGSSQPLGKHPAVGWWIHFEGNAAAGVA